MPSHRKDETFRPFKHLGRLIEKKKITLKEAPLKQAPKPGKPLSPQQEAELFNEAMSDVQPIAFDRYWQLPKHCLAFESMQNEEEQQTLQELCQLIDIGKGFNVADTSEYMEATGPGTHRRIAHQLHKGRFSVQDHIDLHGLTAQEADTALHTFIRKAIREGKRAVLVIHGRGLTSPRKPVLKNKVFHWLTRGPLRKYVIALTSARNCDGGAGATYVLLRQRPMTKKIKKKADSRYCVPKC